MHPGCIRFMTFISSSWIQRTPNPSEYWESLEPEASRNITGSARSERSAISALRRTTPSAQPQRALGISLESYAFPLDATCLWPLRPLFLPRMANCTAPCPLSASAQVDTRSVKFTWCLPGTEQPTAPSSARLGHEVLIEDKDHGVEVHLSDLHSTHSRALEHTRLRLRDARV